MLRHKSAWAAVTVAGLALVAAAGLAAPHWLGQAPRAAAMDTAAGQHSSRTSAQAAAQLDRQAGAKLISSTTAGFTRSRIRHAHRRLTHPTAQPSPSGAVGSGTVSGPVTRGTDCVASPHACGFPDATNTGADCSSLAPSGSVTVTTNGAVVEGKNISGSITVQASNVMIRNDCVTSSDIYPVHFVSGSNLTVEDTTITGTGQAV